MMRMTSNAAEQRVLADAADRAVDEDRLVVGTDSVTPGTSRLMRSISRARRSAICTVFSPDCLVTLHADAGLAVDADEAADVLGAVAHVGDVAHVDRHAVARQHDQVADLVEVGELAGAAQQVRAGRPRRPRRAGCSGSRSSQDLTMRSTERLSAVVFSRDSSTRICRRRPPSTLTAATPATRSRRGARSFSAMSRSVTASKSPSTAMPMIGNAVESNLKMIGGSASSGRRPRTRSMRLRTSSAASLRLVPQAKLRRTTLLPSRRRGVDLLEAGDGADRLLDRPGDRLLHLARADAGVVRRGW